MIRRYSVFGVALAWLLTSGSARSAPQARRVTALPHFNPRHLDAEIFARASRRSRVLGLVRRGSRVAVRAAVKGGGCPRGRWYPTVSGGFLCTAWGFRLGAFDSRRHRQPRFRTRRALPYDYVKSRRRRAPMLRRLPTGREARRIRRAVAGLATWPRVVLRRTAGAYFLAVGRRVTHGGRRYLQTVRGEYLRAEDVRPFPASRLKGEPLAAEAEALPLAFVITADATALGRREGAWRRVANLRRYHRERIQAVAAGDRFVVTRRGRRIARRDVRVARRRARPARVPPRARWVHFDLAEQVFTAYEGDRPVYASLLSSGKAPYRTPTGTYRIYAKHRSVTMRGPDPDQGWYYIEEVPWTMFYHRKYAVHGAYWHDRFGRVKSHGCTNLAPTDARWLFLWTTPRVPSAWHARLGRRGTWFVFTR